MRSSLLCSCLLCISACIVRAQPVQWAARVVRYSSQYSPTAGSARQILGKPNVLPTGGHSPMAWAVAHQGKDSSEAPEQASITVAFDHPMKIRQIAVGESNAPGAISRIVLIDADSIEHEVYSATPHAVAAPSRMLNLFMPTTPYLVAGATITIEPGEVDGWNELDAVGISASNDSIKATINVVPNLTSTSQPENLGPNVNSAADERIDAVAPDGKTLYVSRNGHPGNIGHQKRTDLWMCTLDSDGHWSPAVNLGPPINNAAHNFANSITPDGNSLLLANTYYPNGSFKGPGLSMAHRIGSGWSVPEDVVIDDWYNDGEFANYCLSPDQKVLMMSLQRADSYGVNDLYVSFLQPNGTWSRPKNIGPTVNTIGKDMAPFIAADGVTLYYSTNGLSGFGDNDIFITRRLDDSWTNWSEPQNIGRLINTPTQDDFYVVSASGDYAYFSSQTNSLGRSDVFRIALPKALRPKPVILVHGRVFNAKTKEPIASTIRYEVLPKGEEAGIARSNPATGEYKIALPVGSNFGFRAEAEGFYPASENLNTTRVEEYSELERDLYLTPIEVGAVMRLNNIFFETGKWDLQPESFPELDRVVTLLNQNTAIRISISGHTDDVGSDAANLSLSKNRARAVYEYLAQHGVATNRLSSNGYGETKPVATNETEEGRQLNRRVEFTILSK